MVPMVGHFRPEIAHDWGTGPCMVAWALGCAFFFCRGVGQWWPVVGGILGGRGGLWLRGT